MAEKEKRKGMSGAGIGYNLLNTPSMAIDFVTGSGPRILGAAAGGLATRGVATLIGDDELGQNAKNYAKSRIDEETNNLFKGDPYGENDFEDLLKGITTDLTTSNLFRYLDMAKEGWSGLYNKTIGYPGSSLPAKPRPDKTR